MSIARQMSEQFVAFMATVVCAVVRNIVSPTTTGPVWKPPSSPMPNSQTGFSCATLLAVMAFSGE